MWSVQKGLIRFLDERNRRLLRTRGLFTVPSLADIYSSDTVCFSNRVLSNNDVSSGAMRTVNVPGECVNQVVGISTIAR